MKCYGEVGNYMTILTLPRVKTGISGLDELMDGGFVEKSVNLVTGPAGSGKSLFGMQFIYNGIKDYNEPGIYITIEQDSETIKTAMQTHGMDADSFMAQGKLYLIDLGEVDKDATKRSRSFIQIIGFLENLIKLSRAKRLVVDSISAVGSSYNSEKDMRPELLAFVRFLRQNNVTAVLLSEAVGEKLTRYQFEEFVSDSFITLGLKESDGKLSRTLLLRKMRFTWHDTSTHPFTITQGRGMEILR